MDNLFTLIVFVTALLGALSIMAFIADIVSSWQHHRRIARRIRQL